MNLGIEVRNNSQGFELGIRDKHLIQGFGISYTYCFRYRNEKMIAKIKHFAEFKKETLTVLNDKDGRSSGMKVDGPKV